MSTDNLILFLSSFLWPLPALLHVATLAHSQGLTDSLGAKMILIHHLRMVSSLDYVAGVRASSEHAHKISSFFLIRKRTGPVWHNGSEIDPLDMKQNTFKSLCRRFMPA